MEPDLRFDSPSRTYRMLSVCVAIIVVTLGAVPFLVVGFVLSLLARPLNILHTLKVTADALIALVWYPIEMIRVNWKD